MMSDKTVQTIFNIMEIFVEAPFNRQSVKEALEIIKSYIQDSEVTAYIKEKGVVRRIATTLSDEDEIRCLDNIIMRIGEVSEVTHCTDSRNGVTDMVAIPLLYGGLSGMLICEKYCGQIERLSKDENLLLWVFSTCFTSFIQNKRCLRNLYVDSRTGLPGQEYFLLYVDRVKENGLSQWILVVRVTAYSSQVQLMGIKNWNKMIMEIADLLRHSGKAYRISDDTFGVLLSGAKAEVYDLVLKIKEELRNRYDVKMLLLEALEHEDLMAAIEREIPNCRQGNVYIPSANNNVFDIFKGRKKNYQKPVADKIILDEADIDLFDLL